MDCINTYHNKSIQQQYFAVQFMEEVNELCKLEVTSSTTQQRGGRGGTWTHVP